MAGKGVRLGRFFGIEVAANPSVLVIAALLTWSLAASILPSGAPGLVSTAYWTVALVGALLFLVSLLAHELAHSVVARRNDVEVEGVTLWMFGGVAQFRSDPATPGADFRITAAGPAMSLLLGAMFLAGSFGLSAVGGPEVYAVAFGWLGLINIVLALFNLLPGSPLDGGRLVAAGLWKLHGDRTRGRIGAAMAGRVVGGGLMALGVAEFYFLGGGSGLWTVLIGWFLFGSARRELEYYRQVQGLERIAAAQLAAQQVATQQAGGELTPPPPPAVTAVQHWEAPVPSHR